MVVSTGRFTAVSESFMDRYPSLARGVEMTRRYEAEGDVNADFFGADVLWFDGHPHAVGQQVGIVDDHLLAGLKSAGYLGLIAADQAELNRR